MPYFDRFDIVAAHYYYCCDYHSGQFNFEYERMCRISKYFKPSPLWKSVEDVSCNCQEIYNLLVEKNEPYNQEV